MTFSSFNLIVYTNLEVINPTFGFTVPFWFDFFSVFCKCCYDLCKCAYPYLKSWWSKIKIQDHITKDVFN